ncbi:hypothetical protein JHK85_001758 [Glycine max]|nr:hypothetical protein JHK85_001758 [Glycine max]KAG5089105.1 hypothetical protein JHK86_001717 [Glycine max]
MIKGSYLRRRCMVEAKVRVRVHSFNIDNDISARERGHDTTTQSQAIKELRRLNQRGSTINDDMLWRISNDETWVSTALTDASSCVYSFPGHWINKRAA